MDKIEMCLDCKVFKKNMDLSVMKKTLGVLNKQMNSYKAGIEDRDNEMHDISMGLAVGLSESFEALKKIASGDPSVKIPEESDIELVSKLKHLINLTANEIGEIVDQSHEFAIGIAEHFDILQQVSKGDLDARVSGTFNVELLELLKKLTNEMLDNISNEIASRKKAEGTLRESEHVFKTIFHNAADGILLVDTETRQFYSVNKIICTMLGYSQEELMQLGLMDIHPRENLPLVMEQFKKLARGESALVRDIPVKRKNGSIFFADINTIVLSFSGKLYIMAIFRDTTDRKTAEDVMQALALNDDLTGLYNRRGFITFAEPQLKLAYREKTALMIIFVDLDDMKSINDNFGHKEGDNALIETANILKKTFRGSDIISRSGGDEFVVLAINAPPATIDILRSRLENNLEEFNTETTLPFKLSLSVGFAHYHYDNPCSIEELIETADKAMYEEKQKKHSI